ncbi:MAG: hypothetical protein Kow0090_00970 [Myxococcota bacterium]
MNFKFNTLSILIIALAIPYFAAAEGKEDVAFSNAFKALVKDSLSRPVLETNKTDGKIYLLRNIELQALSRDSEDNARLFFNRYSGLFSAEELSFSPLFIKKIPLINGAVVKIRQSYNGIPVHGGELIIRTNDKGAITRVLSQLKPVNEETEIGRFAITREKAIRKAVSAFLDIPENGVIIGSYLSRFTRAEYLYSAGRLTPVYIVNVPGKKLIDGRALFISAEDGVMLGSEPLVRFAAKAKAWFSNPGHKEDEPLIEVELPNLTSVEEGSFLKGSLMEVYNCLNEGDTVSFQNYTFPICTEKHKATADANGDFLYDPVLPSAFSNPESHEDAFAEVHMYYHTNHVYDYFKSLGFDLLNDVPMMAVVNYRLPEAFMGGSGNNLAPMDNAAFTPKGGIPIGLNANYDMILFGQGEKVDYAYDGDVIYHEFTHAVVGSTSNLGYFALDEQGYDAAPFSLNEGYADLFACTLAGDSEVGEYVGNAVDTGMPKAPSGALRSVNNKNYCPKAMWGEAHEDGKMWSGAVWQIRELYKEKIGGDTLVFDTAAFNALVSLSVSADFYEAATTTLDEIEKITDKSFADEAQAIFESRGLIPECQRVLTLPHTLLFLEGRGTVRLSEVPAPAQFKITVPEQYKNAEVLGIEFSFTAASAGYMGWGGGGGDLFLIAKRDEPIKFDMKASGFPNDSEWEKISFTKTAGLQGMTNYKGYVTNFCFTPGDYYLMIVNTSSSQYQSAYFSAKMMTELNDDAKEARYKFVGECKVVEEDDDDAAADDDVTDDDDIVPEDDDDTGDDDDAADDDDDDNSKAIKEKDEDADTTGEDGCACRIR